MAIFSWQNNSSEPAADTVGYSWMLERVEAGEVQRVTLHPHRIVAKLKQPVERDGVSVDRVRAVVPAQGDEQLVSLLRDNGVEIDAKVEEGNEYLQLLIGLLPLLLIVGVWVWLGRRARDAVSGGGLLSSVGKAPAKRFVAEKGVIKGFDDVAGLEGPKRDLAEIAEFLREPARFEKLGGKVPRGVLLVGPPGTGKTLLARAVAGEANVPFLSISGSEFIQMLVGVGASRVRELFATAAKLSPAIIFIDEIDAVGRSRGTGLGGGNDEREQTLNQLLAEMDGFTPNNRTVVLAATNRPDVLDPALVRPGRFDRQVLVDRPARAARVEILRVHTRNKPLSDDVDLELLARRTPGLSGAELANICNEAALGAARRHGDELTSQDFASALDKVLLGDPRELVLRENERHRIAVHESGHALVALLTPDAAPPERISIIPRGMSLGATQVTPSEDSYMEDSPTLHARLRVLLAGHAAERLVLGHVSSGAENDIERATSLAEKMAGSWGMSDSLGPVRIAHKSEHPFLGKRVASEAGASEATLRRLERQTQRWLETAREEAERVLVDYRGALEALVDALLERESISAAELAGLLETHIPPRSQRRSRGDEEIAAATVTKLEPAHGWRGQSKGLRR